MTTRKFLVRGVLLLIGLPMAALLVAAAWIAVLDRSNGSIVTSGREREYLLYVPASHDRTRPAPLVISLHGAALWPAQHMHMTRWNTLADAHGFVVVYPSGADVPRSWGGRADVQFIAALIDTLQSAYNIDPARIYVNGFSNGGGMAFELSCGLPNRIAAIGTVAPALVLPSRWCTDARPVPVISFHGTADPLAPYDGGTSLASPPEFLAGTSVPFEGVSTWKEYWARRNRCGPNTVDTTIAADVTRSEYRGCADGSAAVFYTIGGGGHAWPGGKPVPAWLAGPTTRSIDASGLMWEFFRDVRLDPAPQE